MISLKRQPLVIWLRIGGSGSTVLPGQQIANRKWASNVQTAKVIFLLAYNCCGAAEIC